MVDKRILIVGGGISGLATAWFLKKRFGSSINLSVLEAMERPGGHIRSSSASGFLFEQGPHSWRAGPSSAIQELICGLGLQDALIEASLSGQNRYIYSNQRLQCLPRGLISLLTSSFGPITLKGLWHDLTAKKGIDQDESIFDFISRRLGKKIAELLFDPLISGIYAGDIRSLSIRSTFPRLQQWEQAQGSILGGLYASRKKKEGPMKVYSLNEGMQQLIDRLRQALHNEISVNSKIIKINYQGSQIALQLASGEEINGDHIFFAIPAAALASIFAMQAPALAQDLKAITTVPLAVVNVGYHQKQLNYDGFGYLVPSKEREKILGVTWDSSTFPTQSKSLLETRLTVMLGGAHFPEVRNLSHEQLLNIALESLKRHLKIKASPDSYSLNIISDGIPQYNIGHMARVQRIETALKALSTNMHLLGNSFHGIGITDCIERAKLISYCSLNS